MLFHLYKEIQTKARMSSAASDHLLQIKSHELLERFWLDETHVTVTGDPSRDSARCDYQGRSYLGIVQLGMSQPLWLRYLALETR
jgi:hypothetical protein